MKVIMAKLALGLIFTEWEKQKTLDILGLQFWRVYQDSSERHRHRQLQDQGFRQLPFQLRPDQHHGRFQRPGQRLRRRHEPQSPGQLDDVQLESNRELSRLHQPVILRPEKGRPGIWIRLVQRNSDLNGSPRTRFRCLRSVRTAKLSPIFSAEIRRTGNRK